MKEYIIYYDMNYYFAAIILLKRPELNNVPLICAPPEGSRGVVSTCNYPARKYGIKSGMAAKIAHQKAPPNSVFMMPDYRDIIHYTRIIHKIALEYTDQTWQMGPDEMTLRMTFTRHLFHNGDCEKIAKELQHKILTVTGLPSSTGLGYNIFSGKSAASRYKPLGYSSFMDRKEFVDYLSDKEIRFLYGVGEKLEIKFRNLRITTIGDLQRADLGFLRSKFGVVADQLYFLANGYDNRSFESYINERGKGNNMTLQESIYGLHEVKKAIVFVVQQVCNRLIKAKQYARTITVRLRYDIDFKMITRSKTLNEPICNVEEVIRVVDSILETKVKCYSGIRLVGVRASNLTKTRITQLSLLQDAEKIKKLDKTQLLKKDLRKKFGYKVVKDPVEMLRKECSYGVIESDQIDDYNIPQYLKGLY